MTNALAMECQMQDETEKKILLPLERQTVRDEQWRQQESEEQRSQILQGHRVNSNPLRKISEGQRWQRIH